VNGVNALMAVSSWSIGERGSDMIGRMDGREKVEDGETGFR